MTLAAVTLEDEYRRCVTQMGFTGEDLRTMARYALDAAFFAGGREARDRWKILISNKYSNIS